MFFASTPFDPDDLEELNKNEALEYVNEGGDEEDDDDEITAVEIVEEDEEEPK